MNEEISNNAVISDLGLQSLESFESILEKLGVIMGEILAAEGDPAKQEALTALGCKLADRLGDPNLIHLYENPQMTVFVPK